MTEIMTPSIVKVVEFAKGVPGFIRRHGKQLAEVMTPSIIKVVEFAKGVPGFIRRDGNSWQKQLTLPLTLLSLHFRVR